MSNDSQAIDSSQIGKRIAETRKKLGMTQKELADQIGITRDLLANYETNRVRIYADVLATIANALNVSTDSLLGLSARNPAPQLDIRWIKKMNDIKRLPPEGQRKVSTYISDLLDKYTIGK